MSAPGDGVTRWTPLAAMLILAANDHWGKAAAPGWFTGKLSDFAGLLFFPLLLQAIWELGCAATGRYHGPDRRVLLVAAISTGVVFSAINLFDEAGALYRWGLGTLQWPLRSIWAMQPTSLLPAGLTVDPTDLVALPILVVAVAIGWRR
ncbi:MAG: hypothetical protein AAFV53_20070 [Myxococcota bacterium]